MREQRQRKEEEEAAAAALLAAAAAVEIDVGAPAPGAAIEVPWTRGIWVRPLLFSEHAGPGDGPCPRGAAQLLVCVGQPAAGLWSRSVSHWFC